MTAGAGAGGACAVASASARRTVNGNDAEAVADIARDLVAAVRRDRAAGLPACAHLPAGRAYVFRSGRLSLEAEAAQARIDRPMIRLRGNVMCWLEAGFAVADLDQDRQRMPRPR
jgi:hypothetical protein